MRHSKKILSSLLLLSSSLFGEAESELSFRNREGRGVGYSDGYTTIDYSLKKNWAEPEFLLNLRAHIFNDAKFAANAGMGFRYSLQEDRFLIGANIFYDYREASYLNSQQIGAGLEFLSEHVDLRVNGYYPIVERAFDKKTFSSFSGFSALIHERATAALPCIDLEIGVPIGSHVYFAAGSYYLCEEYVHTMTLGGAWGAKGRLFIDLGKYFYIGSDVSYDPIFYTRASGYLGLKIPIGPRPAKGKRILRNMPIVRNEIIPLQTKRKEYSLLDRQSVEEPIHIVFVNNQATGSMDGSFENPFDSLKKAEENSVAGDVIYVFPGDGSSKNMDEGIVLKEDQTLASSAGPLIIAEDLIIPPLTPGKLPIITNTHPGEAVITNPGNSTLENFRILPWWMGVLEYGTYPKPFDVKKIDGIGVFESGKQEGDFEKEPSSNPLDVDWDPLAHPVDAIWEEHSGSENGDHASDGGLDLSGAGKVDSPDLSDMDIENSSDGEDGGFEHLDVAPDGAAAGSGLGDVHEDHFGHK